MKRCIFLWVCGLTLLSSQAQIANVAEERQTTAGNIAATLNNLGIIGNGFRGSFNVLDFSSCEYPVNSGIEHVFQGGLWVGGVVNGEIAVSTGAVDDQTGYSPGKSGFEFTANQGFRERSTLFDNPFFDPQALSHQDFVSNFTDTAITINTGGGNIPIRNHLTPLGINVEFESLNWNFPFANFFVILNFTITNVSDRPIDSVFVAYWMDGVIRNVNITQPGGTPFFNKGGNGFIDSLDMGYEFDATGDPGFTDSYVAMKYLGGEYNGTCIVRPDFDVRYNTWQFLNSQDPLYFFPANDLQRFNKMTNGLDQLPGWETINESLSSPNNRSNLVSAGPYPRMNPGDQLEVAFALICAKRGFDGLPASANTAAQRGPLIQNAGWAQTAYNGEDFNGNCVLDPDEDRDGDGRITRFILPSPPEIPATRVVARDNAIDVYWSENAEMSVDPISKEMDFEGYRLYKTQIGFDVQNTQDVIASLNLTSAWDIPGNGLAFDTGLDSVRLEEAVTFPGDTNRYVYRYTFENIANGWQHAIALTAFDQGDEVNNLSSLESSPLANLKRVFAGKPSNDGFGNGEPFVYPNPYYARADWEGVSTFEEDRKVMFANLPPRCEVRIYTLSGDLIDVFKHDEATYQGEGARWFETYSDPETAQFSGGEHAWDLLSQDEQIIARGLYLFVVIDDDTGEKRRGKFVIIK